MLWIQLNGRKAIAKSLNSQKGHCDHPKRLNLHFWKDRTSILVKKRPKPPLTQIYLGSVLYGALDLGLKLGAKRMQYSPIAVFGLLARIGLWLREIYMAPSDIC